MYEKIDDFIDPKEQTIAAKDHLEHINTMREALFSPDGWGCQHVNQDTSWDVPGSPEPANKAPANGPPVLKPKIDDGTDLWEANLRNDGQPAAAAQPPQKPSWDHTPTSNLGGTWGEDDDKTDSSNVWNRTPAAANPAGTQQWGNPAAGGGGAGAGGANNAWGGQREIRPNQLDVQGIDPRDMRTPNARGISGRLTGSSEMWNQQHSIAHGGQMPLNKMVGPTTPGTAGVGNTQWGAAPAVTGPKDFAGGIGAKPVSGWGDESSSPPQRRAMAGFDEGTSLWGQQSPLGTGSNWKDVADPMSGNHLMRGVIGNQNAPGGLPGPAVGAQTTTESNMWGSTPRSGSLWDDDKSGAGIVGGLGGVGTGWNDTPASATWGKNPNKINSIGQGGWPDAGNLGGSDWGSHGNKPQAKMAGFNNEMLRSTKAFRVLVEMGYKKDDVERALIATNLNAEHAVNLLNSRPNADAWRRHDDLTSPSVGGFGVHGGAGAGFPGRLTSAGGPQSAAPFPPNNNSSLLNNIGINNLAGNPNLAAVKNMQSFQMQNYLNQSGGGVGPQLGGGIGGVGIGGAASSSVNATTGGGNGSAAGSNVSAQQLRMLVQQIQMAVQSGFLPNQILNQPLAPATFTLLNQLLTTIKHLQSAQSSLVQNGNMNNLQLNVTIAKYKQQIVNLQSQINAQQAMYVKQQQQQQQQQQHHQHTTPGGGIGGGPGGPSHGGGSSSNAEYLRGQQDAFDSLNSLKRNFSEMNLNKSTAGTYQGTTSQQSRLNQWKLPELDKDILSDNSDFLRAPGKPSAGGIVPGVGVGAGARDRNWPTSARGMLDDENKDWPSAKGSPGAAFTDLVPEFEPGKPWKGTQMKNVEDDPSLTPGSVIDSSNNWMNYGLGSGRASAATNASKWQSSTSAGNGGGGNGSSASTSNWLFLKNLTTQIDGQTLRTLCMQHGPLSGFHLHLNHGIGLCKYTTREEASKAQTALNNCPFGNTTICAELLNESEVDNILKHIPQSPVGGGGNGGASNNEAFATGGSVGVGGNGGSANSAWGSGQANQQSRLPGREADFDLISKYVCALVDD